MTILFVDLVGFTERSDTADPEDVRRTLVPFHEQAKAAIERYGGHLDKFIGDAAMGVFGAPVTHEDDPERAVRAALELVAASDGRAPDPRGGEHRRGRRLDGHRPAGRRGGRRRRREHREPHAVGRAAAAAS